MTQMTFHIFVNFLSILLSYGKVKDKDVLIRVKFHHFIWGGQMEEVRGRYWGNP